MKRICLFAGFDFNNVIHDYVIYYITELSKLADVYYLADNEMTSDELYKLNGITKKAFSFKHGKYDFGSWQELINKIGWDEVEKYEQLILVNDSCYGPLFDLKNVFDDCGPRFDFWGMAKCKASKNFKYDFIQSCFLVLNKNVFKKDFFKHFIKNINKKESLNDVVSKYEKGLSELMINNKITMGSYIGNDKFLDTNTYVTLSVEKYKNPLIKIKTLRGMNPSSNTYDDIINSLKINTNYDTLLIEKHLLSKESILDNKKRVSKQVCIFNIRNRTNFLPKWLFYIAVTRSNKLLIRVFKIPIFNMNIFK